MTITTFMEQLQQELSCYGNLTFKNEHASVSIGIKRPRTCITLTILRELVILCDKNNWCMCSRRGKLYVWPEDMEDIL